jgi:hypothetical protein
MCFFFKREFHDRSILCDLNLDCPKVTTKQSVNLIVDKYSIKVPYNLLPRTQVAPMLRTINVNVYTNAYTQILL